MSAPAALPDAVRESVLAGREKKAFDVKVLDLRAVASFTDYFVLLNGSSVRQVQAIADAVLERLRARGARPLHVEGYAQGEWVLLDYGDFLVHVFVPVKREFYQLERLWRDAETVDVPEAAA